MPRYDMLQKPTEGTRIAHTADGSLDVPDQPVIPFIDGDGVGPEISRATRYVLDAAVEKASKGKRKLHWYEIYAGAKAVELYGEDQWLPEDTLQAIQEYVVALKGPLGTPAPVGVRSLDITMRQKLELYACVRPVRWLRGVPAPIREPDRLEVVVIRENTEDVSSGFEWQEGTPEARKLIAWLRDELGTDLRRDSALGLKPISITGTRRLVRLAIRTALARKRDRVTLVHKGDVMRFTEGAFRDWGYQLAKDEFPEVTLTEQEVLDKHAGKVPKGKVMINDRLAGDLFQEILLRPGDFGVIATSNLNGDYLSDVFAAQVGALGLAPGASFGERSAVFEATHGALSPHAGQDRANPVSLMLSGRMMLEHLGWPKPAALVVKGIEGAVEAKTVTQDLAGQMEGAVPLSTSEFAEEVVKHMSD